MAKKYENFKIKSLYDALEVLYILEKDKEINKTTCEAGIEGIPQKFPFGVWFRGHSDTEWSLEPKVFRFRVEDHKLYSETNLYHHSKLRLAKFFNIYGSTFDWLCIMQHYDIPTRLLDWTESFLIALYFAVRDSNKNNNSDAEIIVLNARKLNKIVKKECIIYSPDDFEVILLSKMATTRKLKNIEEFIKKENIKLSNINFDSPIAVFPSRLNERMIFQSSVYTLHGGKKYNENETFERFDRIPQPFSLEQINQKDSILKHYKIPKDYKIKIEEELFKLGIHEGALFPEIDRQAVYLKKQWYF